MLSRKKSLLGFWTGTVVGNLFASNRNLVQPFFCTCKFKSTNLKTQGAGRKGVIKSPRNAAQSEDDLKILSNSIGVALLPDKFNKKLFGCSANENEVEAEVIDKIQNDIKNKLGIENVLKPVNSSERLTKCLEKLSLPQLYGKNLEEHFLAICKQHYAKYFKILNDFTDKLPPKKPEEMKWIKQPGWTKYEANGKTKSVPFPNDDVLVFDVEICVPDGPGPVLACAASPTAWYSWCCDRICDKPARAGYQDSLSLLDLIPLESSLKGVESDAEKGYKTRERLVIGHNVAFDRARVMEQYYLENPSKMRFIDTMSLHIATTGLSGDQRVLYKAKKSNNFTSKEVQYSGDADESNGWSWTDLSSMNSLVEVHSLHCKGSELTLKKSTRDFFLRNNAESIGDDFHHLMDYCAMDVLATWQILRVLWPKYKMRFPSPVTFGGMLELTSAYLPVNENWTKYVRASQKLYDQKQMELKKILMGLATDAKNLVKDQKYTEDPFLWSLDWTVPKPPSASKSKSQQITVEIEKIP